MSYGMAINPIAYDPYFLQAYQSPNAQQYLAAQMQAAQQAANQATVPVTSSAAETKNEAPAKKKSHKKAWAIIGTVATIGAAALCHKKGKVDLPFFKRIANGAVNCKDAVVTWFKKAFNKDAKAFKQLTTSLSSFMKNGGTLVGEELLTPNGKKFTGTLARGGKFLQFVEGKLVSVV